MHRDEQLGGDMKFEFEPSEVVEYGDIHVQTQGTGGPAAQPDGATYNS